MADVEEYDGRDLSKTHCRLNGRTLRTRQYRRQFQDSRPVKRLFTPEIKRHLKSWLVRRRENPYPNREEKIDLAEQTGLTYIQICNWFANWRRKLKNSGKSVSKYTWSTLIKGYNDRALGNVEHLSISSDDSIWEEPDREQSDLCRREDGGGEPQRKTQTIDHCYSSFDASQKKSMDVPAERMDVETEYLPQCFQISSTTDFLLDPAEIARGEKKKKVRRDRKTHRKCLPGNKSRNSFRDRNWNYRRMMKGLRTGRTCSDNCRTHNNDRTLLTKWRKSVAHFQPGFQTYPSVPVEPLRRKVHTCRKKRQQSPPHGREELDAAEALTFLSRAKVMNLTRP